MPLLPLLVILSCDGDSNNRQIDVNEDVVLNLLPSLNPIRYGLNFSFQSDSVYHCENVGFLYTLESTSDNVSVHLLGVQLPETCITGAAPAFEKLQVPGDEGYYSLVIDIGDYIHNTGTLVIDSDAYSIFMNSQDGMTIPEPKMIRIPVGTIWGYVIASDSDQQNEVFNQVRDDLFPIIETVDLEEGYYGYFSITKPFGIYTEYPNYIPAHSCFVYKFTQDHTVLENTIEQIRAQLPLGAELKVYTWEGFEL